MKAILDQCQDLGKSGVRHHEPRILNPDSGVVVPDHLIFPMLLEFPKVFTGAPTCTKDRRGDTLEGL
jgi:hypothetical protein